MRTFLIAAFALSACASSNNLDQAIGQPIQEAFVRYGPPEAQFTMPDGSVAYQWTKNATTTLPTFAKSEIDGSPYGSYRPGSVSTTVTGGEEITTKCVLTLITKEDAAGVHRITAHRQNNC